MSFEGTRRKVDEIKVVFGKRPDLFDRALDFYLENEGGDVNHSSDPGGLTSRGLASAYNPELGDVTKLSDKEVRAHYRKKYWRKIFCRISGDQIAIKVFDIATNAGFDDASYALQKAINKCGESVVVDGVMGSRTVRAANLLNRRGLMDAVCDEQWKMDQEKMKADPDKTDYYNGWMKRAFRVP